MIRDARNKASLQKLTRLDRDNDLGVRPRGRHGEPVVQLKRASGLIDIAVPTFPRGKKPWFSIQPESYPSSTVKSHIERIESRLVFNV